MGDSLMKTALKDICMGKIEEWVDLKEDSMSFQELRDEAMTFAMKKRTEASKTQNASGMDVDAVMAELSKAVHEGTCNHSEQQGWGKGIPPTSRDSNATREVVELMLNMLSKGKGGKGKGGKGKGQGCWNCGGNHLARNCMLPPKGKGKGNWEQPKGGKGGWSPWGFQGNCYNC